MDFYSFYRKSSNAGIVTMLAKVLTNIALDTISGFILNFMANSVVVAAAGVAAEISSTFASSDPAG